MMRGMLARVCPGLRFAWVSLLGWMLGCAAETSDGPGSGASGQCKSVVPEPRPAEALGWACISAAHGGTVQSPDGAWLEVPPGALASDTLITISVPSPLPANAGSHRLEPAGLELSVPAILHVPYPDLPDGSEPLIKAYVSSTLQPETSAGSEVSNWQFAQAVARDEQANVLSFSVPHFTFYKYFVQVDELAYLVMDLPLRYLSAGDIVATLTNRDKTEGPDWNPGHVGMLYEIAPSGSVGVVMESSPPEGVQKNDAQAFKVDYGHLYLGARRPIENPLSDQERKDLLKFLTPQFGKPYQLIGEGNLTEGAFSCVGLVEAAFDSIGRGMVPWYTEATAITPVEQFRETAPVDEIFVRVDQPIQIPVYGVTVDSRSPYLGTTLEGFYQRDANYTLIASGKPEQADFSGTLGSGYQFSWTPTRKHGCELHQDGQQCPGGGQPHYLDLELHATPKATFQGAQIALKETTVAQRLTIHVQHITRFVELTPRGPFSSTQYTLFIQLPGDVTVHETVFRDEATGAAPLPAPFPNHTLTVTQEGEVQGGVQVTFTLANPTASAVTASPITLSYAVDYEKKRVLAPGP